MFLKGFRIIRPLCYSQVFKDQYLQSNVGIQRGFALFFAIQALLNNVVVNKFAQGLAVEKANQTLFWNVYVYAQHRLKRTGYRL
ncbi:hypothetical protein DSM110093_02672 [Sulfitobacter sp. DSM 110093]|nr:hypothetical protein DSM110093_02672 [Sulfitobacter sp. DSM 110093]